MRVDVELLLIHHSYTSFFNEGKQINLP